MCAVRLRALPCVRLVSISGSLLCFSIDSFTNLESESPREPSINLHSERAFELYNSRPGVTCNVSGVSNHFVQVLVGFSCPID